jgi:pyroglutamyl-peptidase
VKRARHILLTGFEPFAGDAVNPSQEIVRALDATLIEGHRVVGAVLPVVFASTVAAIDALLDVHRPAIVIALGLAGGRSGLSLERVAVNLVDARIADNDGAQPIDEAVIDGAPDAYFSTLPLKAMHARLVDLGIPATISLSAGSFVCNQLFFALAHAIATRHGATRGGFIHVPWQSQPDRAEDVPTMALKSMVAGVHAALACALRTRNDLHVIGGTIA